MTGVLEQVAGLALVDHHCHSTVRDDLDRAGMEQLLTESALPAPHAFDSPLGTAVRRWCAPVLDLPAHASPDDYVARRRELGTDEVTRRMLTGCGTDTLLVDSGFAADRLLDLPGFAAASGARVHEVVRLEAVAQELAQQRVRPARFPDRLREELRTRAGVGWKTIIAYRYGLHVDPRRPTDSEVSAAAARWLGSGETLRDPVLLGFLLWSAIDTGLPLQVHCGFGDPDETLRLADPACLQPFLHAVAPIGTPVMLLHCYPYHRQAAYLAHVYPHVYFDVGLALNFLGPQARTVLAEAMETAPFHKLLYSSDAFGLPELHYLGAVQFRRALGGILQSWVDSDDIAGSDAARIATMMGSGTARRVYRLEGG